jgi:hypothetical protein
VVHQELIISAALYSNSLQKSDLFGLNLLDFPNIVVAGYLTHLSDKKESTISSYLNLFRRLRKRMGESFKNEMI